MEQKFGGEYILTKKLYKKFKRNKLRINRIIVAIRVVLLLFLIYNFLIVQDYVKVTAYSAFIMTGIILLNIINSIISNVKYKEIVEENQNKMGYEIIISDGIYTKNKKNGKKTNCNFRTISKIFKNSQMLIAKTKIGELILIPEKLNGGTEKELKQYLLEKCENAKTKRIIGLSKYIILYQLIILSIMATSIYWARNQKNFMDNIISNFNEEANIKDITNNVNNLYSLLGEENNLIERYLEIEGNSTLAVIYEFKSADEAKKTLAQWIVDIQKREKTKFYEQEPNLNGEKYILANEKIFHICIRNGRYVYYSTSSINDKETAKSFLKTIGWYDEDFIKKIDNYI